MKLLICASECFPHGSGIGNVVYNVAEHLKSGGVEYTICSPTGPDIFLGNEKLIEKCGFIGLLYYWYQVSRFFNKKNVYDMVWLHNPYFFHHNPFPRCVITMQSTYYGLSLHHVGNTRLLWLYYEIISKIEPYLLRKINKTVLFTGVGKLVCEELEKMGIEKERTAYILSGGDIQQFKPIADKKSVRKKFGIPENDIVLISVGRLTPAKRPQTLINIFSLLEKKIPNLTLCIAGKGELLDTTKSLVQKNGLHKVIFLGYVSDQDLPELYACSDYYIIASIYEGGMPPLTLSEAMSSGLPCIVSDIPNFSIVNDAGCGIIVNFNDTDHAAEEIMEYVTKVQSDHAKNAREFALKRLDWEIISKQYLEIFTRESLKKST